jgi:acetyltransferase
MQVAKLLGTFRKKFSSISASFVGGTKIKKALEELEKKKIPNFESPERALMALQEAMGQRVCQRDIFSSAGKRSIRLKFKTNAILEKAKTEKRKMLFWKETEVVFGEYGIFLAKSQTAKAFGEINFKKLKFPGVLKTDDPKIAHRWDKKAVALNIKDKKELKISWDKIRKATGAGSFLIQPMAKSGLEVIIGMKRDQNFGPVVIVGGGGTFTEIMKDRVILIPPFSEKNIRQSLSRLKIFPILRGFRGEKEYELDEIAKIAMAVQSIAIENPGVAQIDINPAMLYNDGRKYQILDAKIYL